MGQRSWTKLSDCSSVWWSCRDGRRRRWPCLTYIWIGDEHARGYLQSDFESLYARYIPRSEVEALLAELDRQRQAPGQQAQQAPEPAGPAEGKPTTDDANLQKGEPGEAQGGEAAAA